MPFSHHSHSGEFCGHAKDKLEDVVLTAVQQGMQLFALTEHMPRNNVQDLYPEERETNVTPEYLDGLYARFYAEARRLQKTYDGRIAILVGMEIDWIRPSSRELIEALLDRYPLDTFIGSIHHVHGIPIDYNDAEYKRALEHSAAKWNDSSSAEDRLFEDYFDQQLDMLRALRPPIVGHFDLIRLLSSDPNRSIVDRPQAWQKAMRNLKIVREYGGLLEINSAAIRKGLQEPYPEKALVKKFLEIGGRFVLSDDSHGVAQVGACYTETLTFASRCGVPQIMVLERGDNTHDSRFPGIGTRQVSIRDLMKQS